MNRCLALCFLIFIALSCGENDKNKISLGEQLDIRSVGGESVGKEKEEKSTTPDQSYYLLEERKFFALPYKGRRTYVNILFSLAYPHGDLDYEKEIIIRRDQIIEFIRNYISLKKYSQLNSSTKREALKTELLKEINKTMKKKISDLYYIKFFVILQ